MRCPEIKGNNCVLDQYGNEDHADSGDEYFGSALNWIVHTNVFRELYIQLFWENCIYKCFGENCTYRLIEIVVGQSQVSLTAGSQGIRRDPNKNHCQKNNRQGLVMLK